MTDTATLDRKLRQVQSLMARANHPNTPPAEAESCLAKAEKLMEDYRIEESQLGDAGKLPGFVPVWRTFNLCSYMSEFRSYYGYLMWDVVRHMDIRCKLKYVKDGDEAYMAAEMCGYESDLRFAELIYTEAALAFAKRLEPKYDPELSDQVNAYLMRSAGMEGRRIAMAIYGKDDKHLRPKVRAMFKAEAEARGEDPSALTGKGNNVKTYRTSYADGFVGRLGSRLRDTEALRGAEGVIVLRSRKDVVDEAYWTKYPNERPKPVSGVIGETENTAPCKKCAKAKSGKCRDHAWRMGRTRERAFSAKGYNAGTKAADSVNLKGA